MIIKTKGQLEGWRFYHGANMVEYHKCQLTDVPTVVEGDTAEADGITYVNLMHFGDGPSTHCVCITFQDLEGKNTTLYVNQETYLLNDAGKTIERLF